MSQTAANNTITIKYTALPYQESIIQTDTPALWSNNSVITSYWSVDQDNPLGSGTSVANSIMDTSLVRSGYSYYVTDQRVVHTQRCHQLRLQHQSTLGIAPQIQPLKVGQLSMCQIIKGRTYTRVIIHT
ncbi:hypothetical protein ACLSJW_10020 [Weissella cibaria]|uniref:hypothetical protein n=1 Tax=Weissella cibaria TaxID=137591 RepID=UPI0039A74840